MQKTATSAGQPGDQGAKDHESQVLVGPRTRSTPRCAAPRHDWQGRDKVHPSSQPDTCLLPHPLSKSQAALVVKKTPANAGDLGSIPGLGRSPGGGHGNPLQYSCLENPMGRGAWSTTVHRVTKSGTQLKQLSTHTHTLQIVPPSHRDSSCPLPVTSSPFLFMHFFYEAIWTAWVHKHAAWTFLPPFQSRFLWEVKVCTLPCPQMSHCGAM